MVELAFTHLGYFFKSGFREAHFLVFWLFFFFLVLPVLFFVLCQLPFVVFPCFKSGVLIKLLLGICGSLFQFLLVHELVSCFLRYHFLLCRYSVWLPQCGWWKCLASVFLIFKVSKNLYWSTKAKTTHHSLHMESVMNHLKCANHQFQSCAVAWSAEHVWTSVYHWTDMNWEKTLSFLDSE